MIGDQAVRQQLLIAMTIAALSTVPVHAKNAGKSHGRLPPGVQKKVDRGGSLPPGWEKKLKKGAILDLEVYRHGQPVSSAMKARLPIGDKGTIDIRVEGKIIRLYKATRTIVDVFNPK